MPLLVVMPGSAEAVGKVGEPVSLRDLPATVVDLLGLKSGSPFPGESLAGHWDRSKPVSSAPAVSELASPNPADPNQGRSPARKGPLTALAIDKYAYIRGAKAEELFDESADPAERHDLAALAANSEVLVRFRGELERLKLSTNPR